MGDWGSGTRKCGKCGKCGETRERIIPNIQCPMPNAPCSMPHAPCPMPNYDTVARDARGSAILSQGA
ncbi:hypothetical protein B4U84_10515 [Westiellopsis prolifica IICB1]|nr:hypothetical protein B4U84_10515 [Westiellopsis prolifica IICB1]